MQITQQQLRSLCPFLQFAKANNLQEFRMSSNTIVFQCTNSYCKCIGSKEIEANKDHVLDEKKVKKCPVAKQSKNNIF